MTTIEEVNRKAVELEKAMKNLDQDALGIRSTQGNRTYYIRDFMLQMVEIIVDRTEEGKCGDE